MCGLLGARLARRVLGSSPLYYLVVWYEISLADDAVSVEAGVLPYHCIAFIGSCTQGLYRREEFLGGAAILPLPMTSPPLHATQQGHRHPLRPVLVSKIRPPTSFQYSLEQFQPVA